MNRIWDDIKWIFEPDGSLRDIYIQDVVIRDWEKLIDFLNITFDLKFGDNNKIDKEYVIRYLGDKTGKMECKSLSIDINGITIKCYFFLSDQIEFDIDPNEIKSLEHFEAIESFMTSISKTLHNQVTLTDENTPKFPLIKIDVEKGINKVLTKSEAIKLSGNRISISNQLSLIKAKLKMRFLPNLLKKQMLESANELYRSTGKNENVW